MAFRSNEELEEIKASLKRMIADKLTQTQIAERLNLTKGQVQGLISRHIRGYKSRKINRDWTDEAIAEAKQKMHPQQRCTPSLPTRVDEMVIVLSDLSFDPPEGKINIYNVKQSHCRYLDGEGFFCGEQVSKASYCEHHYNLCYVPPRRKERQWRSSLPSPSVNFV